MEKIKLHKYIKLSHPWVNSTGDTSKNDLSRGLHGTKFMTAWDEMFGLRTIPVIGDLK